MLGSIDYAIWLLTAVLEAGAVVCVVCARSSRKYFPLVFYMLAEFIATAGRFIVFLRFGYASQEYFYFYYYSDALEVICLYCALMGLYSLVFEEMGVSRYLRVAGVLLLGATAGLTYAVVSGSRDRLLTHFVVELSQNLYFVGVILTYLLWGAILKLRETRTRLIQLVLALGVAFSATAGSYALRNLFPDAYLLRWVPPIMGVWLPLAWAYTLTKVPEDARLATARLVARAR